MRHRWLGFLIAIALVGTAGPVVAAETHVVSLEDGAPTPSRLSIREGDVVRWEWKSGAAVRFIDGTPEDEDAGERFDFTVGPDAAVFTITFEQSGSIAYFNPARPEVGGVVEISGATPVNTATWGYVKRMFEPGASLRRLPGSR